MRAGHDIVTVAGWSSLTPGTPWVSSTFVLSRASISVVVDGASGSTVVALADVVGLDQIDDGADGFAVLEFALVSGAVIHMRVPATFVDEVVEALQQSRVVAPPEPLPAPLPEALPEPLPIPARTMPEPVAAPDPASTSVERDLSTPPELLSADIDDPPPPPPGRSGSKSALAAEVKQLRDYLEGLGFPERKALRTDVDSLIAHRTEVLADLRAANRAVREAKVALVHVRKESVLQDVGVYRPRHPAEDSTTLKERLEDVHRRIDEIVEGETAVTTTDDWTVNGSRAEGDKVVGDLAQLLLRTYNAEADLLVATLRPYELDAAVDRLTVTLATIHRLGASMQIEISDELHKLRVEELSLAADQLDLEERARREAAAPDPGAARFVVVTSNRGALGEGVVRVGASVHEDPVAIVDEADGGRLPFRSDLHAVVPSADAAALLASIRAALDARRVNLTDPSCPFFLATPAEVRDLLVGLGATVPSFVVDAAAEEWRQSDNARHPHDDQ